MRALVLVASLFGAGSDAQQTQAQAGERARAQECAALQNAIQVNDAEGRRGGSAEKMERLREERKRIRQRQSELKC